MPYRSHVANGKKCRPGTLEIRRVGYTTKRGTKVKATSYCAPDRGRPGRGPKTIPTPRKGALGGPGYTSKSATARHRLLNKHLRDHGYSSTISALQSRINLGKRTLSRSALKVFEDDKHWVQKTHSPKKRASKRNAPSTYHSIGHTGDHRTKSLIGTPDHINIKRLKKPEIIKETAEWLQRHPPVGSAGWVTMTDKRGYRIGTWESESGVWKTRTDPRPASKRGKSMLNRNAIKRNAASPTETRTAELLWSGLGRDYGWRIYRQPWDGAVFILNAGGSKRLPYWQDIDPAKVPKRIRERYEKIVAKLATKKNAARGTAPGRRNTKMSKKTIKRNAKVSPGLRKAQAVKRAMAIGVTRAKANELYDAGKLTAAGRPKKGARGIPQSMKDALAAPKKTAKKKPRKAKKKVAKKRKKATAKKSPRKVSKRKVAKKLPARKSKRPGAKKKGGVCYKKGTKKVTKTVKAAARRVQRGEKGRSGRPLAYQRWCRNFNNLSVPESELGF